MNEKRFILSIALKECMRNVDKLNKNINALSDKLSKSDDSNSTAKRRAHRRMTLSIDCEERDRWQNRIDIINKWMKEIE